MKALYVDINASGTAWNRPCELSQVEATNCLADAVNDYSSQVRRLEPEILSTEDLKLAAALEAWPERPPLPPPTWPP